MKRASWDCCTHRHRTWGWTDRTIHSSLAVTIRACRHHRVTRPITPATGITPEVNRVRLEKILKKSFFEILSFWPTDVEIQKIRPDKINPAYSPAQSEPESPGKSSFRAVKCVVFKTMREKSTGRKILEKGEKLKSSRCGGFAKCNYANRGKKWTKMLIFLIFRSLRTLSSANTQTCFRLCFPEAIKRLLK